MLQIDIKFLRSSIRPLQKEFPIGPKRSPAGITFGLVCQAFIKFKLHNSDPSSPQVRTPFPQLRRLIRDCSAKISAYDFAAVCHCNAVRQRGF